MRKSWRILCALVLVLILGCAVTEGAVAEHFGYLGSTSGIQKIELTESSNAVIAIKGRIRLSAYDLDTDEQETLVSFKSSAPKVAKVSKSGLVKALKTGSTVITAVAESGSKYRLKLKVLDPANPTGMKFTKKSVKVLVGMKSDLSTMLQGKPYADAINLKTIKWSSSNANVVKVNGKGVVTAIKAGSATITAKARNGKTASMIVVVGRNYSGIVNDRPSMGAIGYGQEIYLRSVDIVSPSQVNVEYYLLFKRLTSITTTHFSWIEDTITCWDSSYSDKVTIVDGKITNIPISTPGQTIKVFQVSYTGSRVKDTNINLAKNRDRISNSDDFWLNWLY